MRKAGIHFLLAALYLGQHATAQAPVTADLNTWLLLLNKAHISKKTAINNELHERVNGFSKQTTFIIRPSIEYTFNKHLEASLGVSLIWLNPYKPFNLPVSRNELNLWEQVSIRHDLGKVHVQHRIREEQRFLQKIWYDATTTGYYKNGREYENRFRYRLLLTVDLKKSKNGRYGWFAAMSDEIWLTQQDNLLIKDFSRNRVYAGLGCRLQKQWALQLGYAHQHDMPATGNTIVSPIAFLTVSKNFEPTGTVAD